jgi:hypothetical protein
MKRWLVLLFVIVFVYGFTTRGQAATYNFDFDGNLTYHNDIAFHDFTLHTDATNVRIWTDSYWNGVNFDPVLALWTASGDLIDENDDNPFVHPSQTYADSGIALASLSAGNYRLSIAVFDNFATGPFSFTYDDDLPILLSDWGYLGGYYHVNFEGTVTVIPVPATLLLLGSGVLGLLGLRRKYRVIGLLGYRVIGL